LGFKVSFCNTIPIDNQMKRLFVVLISLFFGLSSLMAQRSNEIGVFLGGSFYLGDLNPNGFFKFTQPAVGAIYRYNINNRFSARLSALVGTVEAFDSKSPYAYQQARNLNFKSPIDEFSGQFEFNFFEYEIGNPKFNFSPYIFGGLGFFRMNPKGEINGQWVALQPLHTEGQGTQFNPNAPYHLIQPCIPFGIGIKVTVFKTICMSVEWGMRKTFTGYIDDVNGVYPNTAQLAKQQGPNAALALAASNPSAAPSSELMGSQRGNGKDDWYSFVGVIFSWHAKKMINACFSYF
jgi:Domain of unknown function (DUF6089)